MKSLLWTLFDKVCYTTLLIKAMRHANSSIYYYLPVKMKIGHQSHSRNSKLPKYDGQGCDEIPKRSVLALAETEVLFLL